MVTNIIHSIILDIIKKFSKVWPFLGIFTGSYAKTIMITKKKWIYSMHMLKVVTLCIDDRSNFTVAREGSIIRSIECRLFD